MQLWTKQTVEEEKGAGNCESVNTQPVNDVYSRRIYGVPSLSSRISRPIKLWDPVSCFPRWRQRVAFLLVLWFCDRKGIWPAETRDPLQLLHRFWEPGEKTKCMHLRYSDGSLDSCINYYHHHDYHYLSVHYWRTPSPYVRMSRIGASLPILLHPYLWRKHTFHGCNVLKTNQQHESDLSWPTWRVRLSCLHALESVLVNCRTMSVTHSKRLLSAVLIHWMMAT